MGLVDIAKGGWDLLTGQGEQKAKNVETASTPERTADQQQIWDGFMSSMFGSDYVSQEFDADYYLKNNPDVAKYYGVDTKLITDKDREKARKHYEKYGRDEGREPYDPNAPTTKSLLERMQEDDAYLKSSDTNFVNNVGVMRDDYISGRADTTQANIDANNTLALQQKNLADSFLNQLASNTGNWNNRTDKLINNLEPTAMQAPVQLKLGNFSTPFITGSQRYAQGAYGGLNDQQLGVNNSANQTVYDTRGNVAQQANDIAKQNSGYSDLLGQEQLTQGITQEQLQNNLDNNYTPNKVVNEYQNILNQIAQWQEQLRYSIPTTTSTGSFNPPTNIIGGVSDIMGLFSGGGGGGGVPMAGFTGSPPTNSGGGVPVAGASGYGLTLPVV